MQLGHQGPFYDPRQKFSPSRGQGPNIAAARPDSILQHTVTLWSVCIGWEQGPRELKVLKGPVLLRNLPLMRATTSWGAPGAQCSRPFSTQWPGAHCHHQVSGETG